MIDATIDLHRLAEVRPSKTDPPVRTAMLTMVVIGAGVTAIAVLIVTGRPDLHVLGVRLISDVVMLFTLALVISTSKSSGVAQLRREIVADVVAQVSAVVAQRVVNRLQGEIEEAIQAVHGRQPDDARYETLASHQEALTREVARQRGQLNAGLRELAEAMQRVEAFVKADLEVVYDLGAQSTRD